MAQTYSNQLKRDQFGRSGREAIAENPREIGNDLVERVTEYARQNPGYAAIWCVGIGFVLGWRLKPW